MMEHSFIRRMDKPMKIEREFVFYFWITGWDCIQLGLHVALSCPNIEIHIPFGFFRIGWIKHYSDFRPVNTEVVSWRGFGLMERWDK